MSKTAIILGAGQAERMLPLSARRVKPMFLLAGKPVIQHAVEAAKEIGADRIVVVTPAGDATIQGFLGDGKRFDVECEYVEQTSPRGTANAIRDALPVAGMGGCFLLPGGSFLGVGSAKPLNGATGTTLLAATATGSHRQAIPVVRGQQLQSMAFEDASIGSTRVSTMMAWMGGEFLEFLLEDGQAIGAFEEALGAFAGDHEVSVLDAAGTWEPVVDAWDLVRINELALHGTEVRLGEGVDIHETAVLVPPVWIGDGVHIGERAVIGPFASIRTNARIGPLSEVRDSIINNNVRLDTRAVVRGAILDDGVEAGPGCLAADGAIIGADATIGSGVIFEGPCIVDADAMVESGRVVKE